MSRKTFFWITLCIIAVNMMFLPCFVVAKTTQNEDSRSRVVRVGGINIDNFLETHADGSTVGYGVAYLNEIAKHTGWSYVYVQGSWSECMQWLRDGKIDLLFPAERSAEREKSFIFSKESCCMDYVALYTRLDNKALFYEDYDSFEGLTVGMINDNQLNEAFEEFLKHKHINIKRVYFPEAESMKKALSAQKIDAIVYGAMNDDPNQKLLAKIDYMHAYFMMEKKNTDLMQELEYALHELYIQNPYFTSRLYEQYYKEIDHQAVGFTRKEMEYILKSGSIAVACEADNYPFEWYNAEKKRYEGVYLDILRKIQDNSGLSFSFLPSSPTQTQKTWERLKSKEAVLLVSATDSPLLRTNYDMICSDSYFTETYTLIGKRGVLFDADTPYKIAVQEDQIGTQYHILQQYPHWKIVPCASIRECLMQVSMGNVAITCINAIALQIDPYVNMPGDLTAIFTASLSVPVSIGISAEQPLLRSIINKSIHKLTNKDIQYSVLSNTLDVKRRISFSSLILYFPKTSIFLAFLLSSLMLFFIFIVYRNRMQLQQNRVLAENYRQLQEVIQQREELKTKSEMDMLTGLYNKTTFCKLATSLLELKNGDYTLFFIDIDNFKLLNDNYGHIAGDNALKNVASILQAHFRNRDIVGRFGGDEFYVFMPSIPEQALLQKLEKITLEISNIRLSQEIPTLSLVTISIGIAQSPDDGATFEELLFKADKALYRAKEAGRNRIEIYQES